jgi:hypothetical protein
MLIRVCAAGDSALRTQFFDLYCTGIGSPTGRRSLPSLRRTRCYPTCCWDLGWRRRGWHGGGTACRERQGRRRSRPPWVRRPLAATRAGYFGSMATSDRQYVSGSASSFRRYKEFRGLGEHHGSAPFPAGRQSSSLARMKSSSVPTAETFSPLICSRLIS